MAKTEFFITVEPTITPGGHVRNIRATSLTQKRPQRWTRTGSVTVKLALDIPDSAFLPLRPQVSIVVPEDMAKVNLPISASVEDPDAQE